MNKMLNYLIALIIVMGSSAFTSEETDAKLEVVKYSHTHVGNDTYFKITLNNDVTVPLSVQGEILTSENIEFLIASFTQKQLRAMVEAPTCESGNTVHTEYVGTNFAKVTCEHPGSATLLSEECKTYNPYTARWQTVVCWPE